MSVEGVRLSVRRDGVRTWEVRLLAGLLPLFFGLFGASIGVCFHRGSTVHFGSELEPGRYVLTVDAGDTMENCLRR